jgi:predicted nucleic acid-binding protein
MATTGGSPPHLASVIAAGQQVFLDTNVLIYWSTPISPFHSDATVAVASLRSAGKLQWISRQIIREYLSGMTRPSITPPVPMSQLINNVLVFQNDFLLAEDGPPVTTELLQLLSQIPCGGKQVHDANIVATMRVHGIPNLLTNNPGDFARFGHLINVIPLAP